MLEVWAADNCADSTRVCELLADRGIPFDRCTPSVSELRASARTWNATSLPQVFDDEGTLIGGYTETAEYLSQK